MRGVLLHSALHHYTTLLYYTLRQDLVVSPVLSCHVADDLPAVGIPELLPDAGGRVAVGRDDQGSDLTEVPRDWGGSVISRTVGVLQPHVLGLQSGRDLAHAGHPVLCVVLLVVIHCLVYEKDPVVEVFV